MALRAVCGTRTSIPATAAAQDASMAPIIHGSGSPAATAAAPPAMPMTITRRKATGSFGKVDVDAAGPLGDRSRAMAPQ